MAADDKEQRELRSLDFFMGLLFSAVGIYVIFASFGMFRDPLLKGIGVPIASNPGLSSLVIGGFLLILGATLLVIGLLGAGNPFQVGRQALAALFRRHSFWRSWLVLGLLALYFFVLWQNTPFWFSTMAFLCLSMRIFRAGAWWQILLIAGITTALIMYFFGHLALVPLPSDPGLLKPLYDLFGSMR